MSSQKSNQEVVHTQHTRPHPSAEKPAVVNRTILDSSTDHSQFQKILVLRDKHKQPVRQGMPGTEPSQLTRFLSFRMNFKNHSCG